MQGLNMDAVQLKKYCKHPDELKKQVYCMYASKAHPSTFREAAKYL